MSAGISTTLRHLSHSIVIYITNNGCFIITILKHQSIYAATWISDHLFH